MTVELYENILVFLVFIVPWLWWGSSLIQYWKLCRDKKINVYSVKELYGDKELNKENKKLLIRFIVIALIYLVGFFFLAFSSAYLKKQGIIY